MVSVHRPLPTSVSVSHLGEFFHQEMSSAYGPISHSHDWVPLAWSLPDIIGSHSVRKLSSPWTTHANLLHVQIGQHCTIRLLCCPMLPKMISVGMPHDDFVKSLLAVIRTVEQSFVRAMPQQHDTLLRRDMMQQMPHLFCWTAVINHLCFQPFIQGWKHGRGFVFGMYH